MITRAAWRPGLSRAVRSPVAALLALLAATTCAAQVAPEGPFEVSLTGQPTRYLVEGAPYRITGPGGARFGMSVAELRAVIGREHPEALASLREDADPETGGVAWTIQVPSLAPAALPGSLRYHFGAHGGTDGGTPGGRLVAIDAEWRTDGPSTAAQRTALVEAAKAVGATMAGWRWPPLATTRGRLLPDGTLIVFAGRDAEGAGAEIRLTGVDVDVEPRARTAASPARAREHRVAPPGPSMLRLRLAAAPSPASAPATASAASASEPGQPVASHRVTGFRSARFGMDEDELRAAIARDFGAAADALQVTGHPTEGTRALVLRLAALEPGPGAATISYLLGATSHRLIHVNVVWSTGNAPDEAQRQRMVEAGGQLARYFQQLGWRPGATTSRLAPDGSHAVLFAGVDPRDAALELRISGVQVQRLGQPAIAPRGPAVLRVAYFATSAGGDIEASPPGVP